MPYKKKDEKLSRLKELEEIWPLNAMCDPEYSVAIKDIIGTIDEI